MTAPSLVDGVRTHRDCDAVPVSTSDARSILDDHAEHAPLCRAYFAAIDYLTEGVPR
jgi:hypothetical protein